MILSVTLNPAVDRTYSLEGFRAGHVFRCADYWVGAGGKGVNVARVLRALGTEALVTGFLGGASGDLIEECLAREGIRSSFTRIASGSRVCITVADPAGGQQTVINEAGPSISEEDADRFLRDTERLLDALPSRALVCMSGSLPRGSTLHLYGALVEACRGRELRSALDTSGEALRRGAEARPWLLKCNALEWAALGEPSPTTLEEAAGRAGGRLGGGTEWVAITLGKHGAVLVDESGAWGAEPPEVPVVNAVGSGDAFQAGLLWALAGGLPGDEALAWAVAAGAANAAVPDAGGCSREQIEAAKAGVRARRLPRIAA